MNLKRRNRGCGRAGRLIGLAAALTLVPAVAAAQEVPPETWTSPSTTTTSTPPPTGDPAWDTSTTTIEPSAESTTTSTTTTSTSIPPPVPDAPEEAPAEAAPDPIPVAPAVAPPSPDIARIQAAIAAQLRTARAELREARGQRDAAADLVVALELRITEARSRTDALSASDAAAVAELQSAKADMQERASEAFMRGNFADLDRVLSADGPGDMARRIELVKSALEADQNAVDEYRAAKAAVDSELAQLATDLATADTDLAAARESLAMHELAVADVEERVKMLEAGSAVAVAGFVFPVGSPHSFIDSFGAPRMPGSPYAHSHQGTDIMAPHGTPLYACERGVVTRMGVDVLGGTKLWLVGASGTRYYYAHLSAFAPGLVEGQTVEAGQLVGFVGDTGNARGGAAHLHFEIHPPGLPAVNPYPVLSVVDGAA